MGKKNPFIPPPRGGNLTRLRSASCSNGENCSNGEFSVEASGGPETRRDVYGRDRNGRSYFQSLYRIPLTASVGGGAFP